MFVTDMHDLTDNKKGIVYILDEWNAETGKFGKIIPYMTGLKIQIQSSFIPILQGKIGYIWLKRISSPDENSPKVKLNPRTKPKF
jgi:hypothetical protein